MTDTLPYKSEMNPSAVLRAITRNVLPGNLSNMPGLSYAARNLLSECWNLELAARPTMEQCIGRISAYSTTCSPKGISASDVSTRADNITLTMDLLYANPLHVPAELKDGGQDWFAVYNPHAPKELKVHLAFSFPHERFVISIRLGLVSGHSRACGMS